MLLRRWAWLYLPAQVGIIFLIPESWSRSEGPLSTVVAFIASLIPSIGRQATFTTFAGVAETYATIIWLMTPLTLVASFGLIGWNPFAPRPSGERIHLGTSRWILLIAAVLFFSALIVLPLIGQSLSPEAVNGAGRRDWPVRLAVQYPLWFAFLQVMNCWLWTLGFLFSVLFVRNFRRIAPRANKGQTGSLR